MDLAPGHKREAIGKMATRLLSRDPVEFNAAINATFTPNVVYRGHALEIRGASNLKHANWLWNTVDSGKPATFELSDIAWDEQKQTATIQTRRYFRPRIFPFLGFSIDVPVRLHIKTTGGSAYVSRYEEVWLAERVLSSVPLVQAVHEALIKGIWTLLILTLSNLAFAAFARIHSFDAVDRAKKTLPADVARGIDSGFSEGTQLAQGWGTIVYNLTYKLTYLPLRLTESSLQMSALLLQRISSAALPYPYIYDSHAVPPKARSARFEETSKPLPAPVASSTDKNENVKARDTLPSQDSGIDANAASVNVGPSVDGRDQGKSVAIESRIATEEKDQPADTKPANGISMFDQIRSEGQDPVALAADAEAKAAEAVPQSGSSGEDDGAKDGNKGSSKKRKNKKKKNAANGTTNGAHAAPPSFKEGLAQAEANQA